MAEGNSLDKVDLTGEKTAIDSHTCKTPDASNRLIDEYHGSPIHSPSKPEIVTAYLMPNLLLSDKEDKAPPEPHFSTKYMDTSVSPRQDFYKYADGTWLKQNPVPGDRFRWDAGAELQERNQFQLHQILNDAAADGSAKAGTSEQRVGDFFKSAMDTNRIEKLGITPIESNLKQIDSIKNTKDMFKVIADLQKTGTGALFGVDVQPDAKNSSIYALQLSQGGLSLPDRDYYLSDNFASQRKAYVNYMTKMFTLEGQSPTDAAKNASTVMTIETELAQASRSLTELRDPIKNYNKESIDQLAQSNSSIPWKQYFSDLGVSKAPYAVVGQPEFFSAVDKMLKEHSIDQWKTYLNWQVLNGAAPFLNHEMEQEHFDFFGKTLNGQHQQQSRWKVAEGVIDSSIGEDLGKLYVDKYFPAESKAKMNELVNNLLSVYKDHLQHEDWMSDATKQKAIEKLDTYTKKIGYPDNFRDYSSLEIKPDDYFGNIERAGAFEMDRRLARVGQPVDTSEWDMTPPTVNAYYNPLGNEIVFPAGILQPPFFDPKMDDAVNYGGIGAVIGHEISHGFDDEGRHFDGKGNLNDWWTDGDAKAFAERAQKIVDQFNNIEPLPGVHINGKQTLGENIADLGGLAIAYDALERELQKDPSKRQMIDGLTPEQRFFISYAQTWRTNTRDEALRKQVTADVHAPGPARAVAPLENMQAFDDAFGIKPGDPMWRDTSIRAKIW